jgi:hypothetical protein
MNNTVQPPGGGLLGLILGGFILFSLHPVFDIRNADKDRDKSDKSGYNRQSAPEKGQHIIPPSKTGGQNAKNCGGNNYNAKNKGFHVSSNTF